MTFGIIVGIVVLVAVYVFVGALVIKTMDWIVGQIEPDSKFDPCDNDNAGDITALVTFWPIVLPVILVMGFVYCIRWISVRIMKW